MVSACKYESAERLLDEEAYEEAAEIFESLGDYEDSAEQLDVSRYRYAECLFQDEEYEDASEYYIALDDYKDSADLAVECAECAAEEGDYSAAFKIYSSLRELAESDDQYKEYSYFMLFNYIKENGEPFIDETFDDSFEYAIVVDSDYGEKAILTIDEADEICLISFLEMGSLTAAASNGGYMYYFYKQFLYPDSAESNYLTSIMQLLHGEGIIELSYGSMDLSDYSEDYAFSPEVLICESTDADGNETEDYDYPLEGSLTEDLFVTVNETMMPALREVIEGSGISMSDLGYNY